MRLLQKKSACCGTKIIRFGGKRRQCTACQKTWRVRPARPGRKALRKQNNYLEKVFCQGFSVKQLSIHSPLSIDAIYKRFDNNLKCITDQRRIIRIRGKKLILIIDALWHYFNGDLWTLYCVSIKASDSQKAVFLDPVLKQGKENATTWNEIIDRLQPGLKKRTVAIVSDGIRGIEGVAGDHKLILQRCHFHLLSTLQKMRGKRLSTPGRIIREDIYQTVKQILNETSKERLNVLCRKLVVLSEHPKCPKRMKMVARDFLRKLSNFRSHLEYPKLNLPTTVNVMESFNSLLRRNSRSVNTPAALHRWAKAHVRFKSIFNCK